MHSLQAMFRRGVLVLVLLTAIAITCAKPPKRSTSQAPQVPVSLTQLNIPTPPPSVAQAATGAAVEAAGSQHGLGGSWTPKAGGVRLWQSEDGKVGLGVGASTDRKQNYGVGFGLNVRF
ncbi:hypothetical protein FJT64_021916 [Amphibalanus amphitrite]|uniref:Uncharacterized protein n=1 Tax=Amphibalanus amphitrite TaxID=1232801 RepID=A0A6A4WII6_AMPAM|nr:hypothetical protein FJT64_021916 [Amphibalanus amphitrite]